MVRTRLRFPAMLAIALALAGCGRHASDDRNLDALDNELVDAGAATGNARDPAMMAALHDQIMVDPALAQQSNTDTVRPPTEPYSGAVPPDGIAQGAAASAPGASGPAGIATSTVAKAAPPPAAGGCSGCAAARDSLTLGALASRQTDKRTRSCAGALRYSAGWAEHLPADLPLYPRARVSEAAGADTDSCRVRAVSFSTDAGLQSVIDWYYARVTAAGYTAEHRADGSRHVLGGTRDSDGGAYALFFTTRRDGGTDVDLLANNGS